MREIVALGQDAIDSHAAGVHLAGHEVPLASLARGEIELSAADIDWEYDDAHCPFNGLDWPLPWVRPRGLCRRERRDLLAEVSAPMGGDNEAVVVSQDHGAEPGSLDRCVELMAKRFVDVVASIPATIRC